MAHEIEDIVDTVEELVADDEPWVVLSALVGNIMSTVGRCEDPHRALLAVIADLTDRVRFAEGRDDEKALDLDDWEVDAWKEPEPENPLAHWDPPKGKPQ